MASWFFDNFAPSVTLATAPTAAQVKDLFFKELRAVRPHPYGFLPKNTRLEAASNHFVVGLTAATADGFQGSHAEHLGIIFDEASGIDK